MEWSLQLGFANSREFQSLSLEGRFFRGGGGGDFTVTLFVR